MGVHRRRRSGITVLDISGEFYGDESTDQLAAAIEKELNEGNRQLILNLVECGMMNSTALGVMIKAKKGWDDKGARIKICGAEKRMKSLLVVVRLYEWFEHYDTEAQAVEAFLKPSEV